MPNSAPIAQGTPGRGLEGFTFGQPGHGCKMSPRLGRYPLLSSQVRALLPSAEWRVIDGRRPLTSGRGSPMLAFLSVAFLGGCLAVGSTGS
jgi:hypothetical protein